MAKKRPRFDELPEYRNTKERHAWGVFGDDDELGTQNLLTEERVLEAAKSVESGEWFSLNWKMELPDPTFFTRSPTRYTQIDLGHLHAGTDDVYDNYFSQSSTQWDALNHVGTLSREMYNGFTEQEIHSDEGRLGIHHVGRRGIAGRYVLIDVLGHWERTGKEIDLDSRMEITPQDLDGALTYQDTEICEGDVVLIHTGWTKWYEGASEEVKTRIGLTSQEFKCEFPGLDHGRDTAKWLWDHGVSCIATDTPAVESGPFSLESYDSFIHYRLIGLLGLTLGEFFYLADLADACRKDGRYAGLFTAAPFNKFGGAGSPANALAIR